MLKSRLWQAVILLVLLTLLVAIACGADGIRTACPWGVPEGGTFRVLDNTYYAVGYSDTLRVPIWVAYVLRPEDIVDADRSGTFHIDERIPASARSTPSDYDEPIYDRGHMAPSATFGRSKEAMQSTYLMSNIAPQLASFNRGPWSALESVVRRMASDSPKTYVVTGCIFDGDGDGIADNPVQPDRMRSLSGTERVAVPTHFYKVVLFWRDGRMRMVGFLLRHGKHADAKEALVPVDSIETETGLDFFSRLPSAVEAELEK